MIINNCNILEQNQFLKKFYKEVYIRECYRKIKRKYKKEEKVV